jgi:BMFP domain-containing protein YqiC
MRRYLGVIDYLESLSLVRRVEVEALEGDLLRLRVTVRGDRDLFGRVVALEAKLLPAVRGADPAEGADFIFEP